MNRTLKNILITTAVVYFPATSSQASTIVQWGAPGGDTGILTSGGNTAGQNAFPSNFDAATLVTPDGITPATGYNSSAAARTNEFSGAFSNTNGVPVFVNNAAGDYMQLLNNFGRGTSGTMTTMLSWNSSDFLTNDGTLESYQLEFRTRDNGDTSTTSFLLETSSGWYVGNETFTSSANGNANYVQVNEHISGLTFGGFNQFGVTAGNGLADTSDILSVGFFSSTNSTNTFAGNFVRHFEVSAVPEPSGAVLSLIGLVFVGLRRRRS